MRIRNLIGENGATVLEYIPENEADREEIAAMQLDGDIPDGPSQSHPQRPEGEIEEEED
jgi:hypothetical protein